MTREWRSQDRILARWLSLVALRQKERLITPGDWAKSRKKKNKKSQIPCRAKPCSNYGPRIYQLRNNLMNDNLISPTGLSGFWLGEKGPFRDYMADCCWVLWEKATAAATSTTDIPLNFLDFFLPPCLILLSWALRNKTPYCSGVWENKKMREAL